MLKPDKYSYMQQPTIITDVSKSTNGYVYTTEDGTWSSRFLMDVPMNKPCIITISINKETKEEYFTSAKVFP